MLILGGATLRLAGPRLSLANPRLRPKPTTALTTTVRRTNGAIDFVNDATSGRRGALDEVSAAFGAPVDRDGDGCPRVILFISCLETTSLVARPTHRRTRLTRTRRQPSPLSTSSADDVNARKVDSGGDFLAAVEADAPC
jgi:hypothetical protein